MRDGKQQQHHDKKVTIAACRETSFPANRTFSPNTMANSESFSNLH